MSGLRDVPAHAAHGAPAAGVERALRALAEVSRWIAWTVDADLPPAPHVVGARMLREAAAELLAAASHFESAAERLDSAWLGAGQRHPPARGQPSVVQPRSHHPAPHDVHRGRAGRHGRPCYAPGMEVSLPIVIGIVVPIIGTVIAGVVALGIMAWRITGRLDRRIDNDKAAADADRRAVQARFDNDKAAADADRRAFQSAMDTFRDEMRRLAERQSHVEGRFDERGSPAD